MLPALPGRGADASTAVQNGDTVKVILVPDDGTHEYIVPAGEFNFMPGGRAWAKVRGADDTVVSDTLKKIRKIRSEGGSLVATTAPTTNWSTTRQSHNGAKP